MNKIQVTVQSGEHGSIRYYVYVPSTENSDVGVSGLLIARNESDLVAGVIDYTRSVRGTTASTCCIVWKDEVVWYQYIDVLNSRNIPMDELERLFELEGV